MASTDSSQRESRTGSAIPCLETARVTVGTMLCVSTDVLVQLCGGLGWGAFSVGDTHVVT